MQKLVDGVRQFQNDIFSAKQHLFEGLLEGQHPLALFITCSDSRINPHLPAHPYVAKVLSTKSLNLHGWVYEFETGEVFSFDPENGQFGPVSKNN